MQGDEAKYQIRIDAEGFNMETDDFEIELLYGMMGKKLTIQKSDTIFSVDGFFFVFQTDDMVGRVTARCTYYIPDIDCADGRRTEVDEQLLCFVCTDSLPQFACVPAPSQCEHKVTYERSEQSDVASDYQYLASVEGDRFITADTEYILVLKSLNA
jgi:hypothetical protein